MTMYETQPPNTLLPVDRLAVLRTLAIIARDRSPMGLAAEIGVYKGGSLLEIAKIFHGRTVFGFDTFAGLPSNQWKEGEYHTPGEFGGTTLEEVDGFLSSQVGNVMLVKGTFPESSAGINMALAFAHIDVDFANGTALCLQWVHEHALEGIIIVVDDYDWPHCPGVKPAVDAFAQQHSYTVNQTAHGQCWLMRDSRNF